MDTRILDQIADGTTRQMAARTTGKDRVDAGQFYRFHRGGLPCAVSRTNSRPYWGHIGVSEHSKYFNCRFLRIAGVRLFKVHMPPSGNALLDQRWWFGFEGSYSYEQTMRDLQAAADAMVEDEDTLPLLARR